MIDAKTKICGGCKAELPLDKFHKGSQVYCKRCRSNAYKAGGYKHLSTKSESLELMNECLGSCLERLQEIEEAIINQNASAEAVKTVMIDVIRENGVKSRKGFVKLTHGSFRYYRGKLEVKLGK